MSMGYSGLQAAAGGKSKCNAHIVVRKCRKEFCPEMDGQTFAGTPENKTGWVDSFQGTGKLTAVKHTMASFLIETYFCGHCKKMIFDTDIQK